MFVRMNKSSLIIIPKMTRVHLIIIMITLMVFQSGCKPKVKCNQFKEGWFKIDARGKTDIINRFGSTQVEFFLGSKDTSTYKVDWIEDCTCTLTPNAKVVKRYNLPTNAFYTVSITGTTDSSYMQTTTANFTDITFTSEVQKTK